MEFNSLAYVLLLLVSSVLFFGAGYRARMVILIIASLVFYAAWNVPLVSLIVISALIDYTAGRLLGREAEREGAESSRRRKLILAVSLTANLGLLAYFKYANFFLENLHDIFGLGDDGHWIDVVLPPGISFYTFQTMSYTIDVYRRQIRPTTSFLRFFLYVTFFPQLIAGPIERAGHLLVQFDQAATRRFRVENLVTGGQMILWGMFKKAVIADQCGLLCDRIYSNPGQFDGWSALVATYAFTLQIYCDFSAYSEIARGSARIFGIDLMRNFDQPYLSTNIAEFWRRWHISLSNWFRDYVYIPLGGNKHGKRRTMINLTITMFLSGLWHGAAWTFVAWGLFHGLLLLITAVYGERFRKLLPTGRAAWLGTLIAWFVNFHLVVLGWIMFRASDMRQFVEICAVIGRDVGAALIGLGHAPSEQQALFIAFVFGFIALTKLERQTMLIQRIWRDQSAAFVFAAVLALGILTMGLANGPAFIYFQF